MIEPRQEASRRLFDLGQQHQGYFIIKRAMAAGFAENTHPTKATPRNFASRLHDPP
jgi:hypothetical protein